MKKNILAYIIGILGFVCIIGFVVMLVNKSNDSYKEPSMGERLPNPEVTETSILAETHKYGDLMFRGFVINHLDSIYTIFVNITNESEMQTKEEDIFIVLYDASGKIKNKISTKIKSLKPYENYVLSVETNKNIFSTYNYDIVSNK